MKPKRLPRLWCALQGLLPLEVRGVPPAEAKKPPRGALVRRDARSRQS